MEQISIFEWLEENNVHFYPQNEEEDAQMIAEHFGKKAVYDKFRWRFKTPLIKVGICHLYHGKTLMVSIDVWCQKYQGGACYSCRTIPESIKSIENWITFYEKHTEEKE